ncbi:Sterol 14-alpha demethylase [Fusarium graminearum]
MGLLQELAGHPLAQQFQELPLGQQVGIGFAVFLVLSVVLNVLNQLLFRNPNEPPMVFHWFPFVGSTITYGMDPPTFFRENRAKHGDVFTFILLGKKTTVAVGPAETTSSSTASSRMCVLRRSTPFSLLLSLARMSSMTAPTPSSWNRRSS